MDIIRYFGFFFRLTKGKIIYFFAWVLVSAFFQMMAAWSFLPVLELGRVDSNSNFITRNVYKFLTYMNITETAEIMAVLLTFACVSFFISSAALIKTTVYVAKLQSQILVDIQAKAADDLFMTNYSYFLKQNMGFLNNIIIQQIGQVAQSFKFYGTIFTSLVFAGLYVAIPFMMQPLLACIMIVMGLPFLMLLYYINKKTKKLSSDSVTQYSRLTGLLIQSLNNFKYLKSTFTYPLVIGKIEKVSMKLAQIMNRLAFWGALSSFGITPFAISLISILIYFQVTVMKTPPIEAVTVLALLYAASQKIITVPTAYQKFLGSFGAISNYQLFIREVFQNKEYVKADGAKEPEFAGSLSLKNVSFMYESSRENVLKNIDIEIKPNSSVAFVGGSGSGKSTLINMISGILVPTEGYVELSGTKYSDLNLFSLRSKIGYVTQEPVIFSDTVRSNITLWSPEGKEKEMIEAARKAHIEGFIGEMPEKYETLLGDSGINISGGQRQRVSIARELFRNTKFLVLDEATSALDTETEQFIQKSIEEFSGKKTIVIVAHRLSTIKNCDKIFVLDEGRIAEQGSYEELYRAGGKFTEMVDRQSLALQK